MRVITIDREFGAGGHSVGRAVAKRLGIEFYDRDIIAQAAASGGIEPSQIEEEEETISKTQAFISAIIPAGYDSKDRVFACESAAIVGFAKQGPCVILGRCASAVLREEGVEVLSVFLHADEEHRIKRAGELLGTDNLNTIRKAIRRKDVARRAYYHAFTGGHWGTVDEHTILLDTGTLGYETCVNIICDAAKAL